MIDDYALFLSLLGNTEMSNIFLKISTSKNLTNAI